MANLYGIVSILDQTSSEENYMVGPLNSVGEVKSAIRDKIRKDTVLLAELKRVKTCGSLQCANLEYILFEIKEDYKGRFLEGGYVIPSRNHEKGIHLRSTGIEPFDVNG